MFLFFIAPGFEKKQKYGIDTSVGYVVAGQEGSLYQGTSFTQEKTPLTYGGAKQSRGMPNAATGQSMCPTNGNCKVCSRLCMEWKA